VRCGPAYLRARGFLAAPCGAPLALVADFPDVVFFAWLRGFGRGASAVNVTGALSFSAALGNAAADWQTANRIRPSRPAGRMKVEVMAF